MKIEQSALALQAQHDYASERDIDVEFTGDFRRALADASTTQVNRIATAADDEQVRLLFMLQSLITLLLRIVSGKADLGSAEATAAPATDEPALADPAASPGNEQRAKWTFTQRERIEEREQTAFSARGQVHTSDGRRIDFDLQLAMCRRFSCERTLEESGRFVLHDPLVVNFNGRAAELSGRRFAFDLDSDGVSENIPELAGSSALLAFDRNGNGRIDDGSELFGTRSGDGFADLARLDDDNNHWIDEADAAYARLQLWQREKGEDSLRRLRDAGIGALGLAQSATPYSLTDADNRLQAQIRATGIYLREDGGAGTLQQVDLAV